VPIQGRHCFTSQLEDPVYLTSISVMKKQNFSLLISVGCLILLFFSCTKNHEPPEVWAGFDQLILLPSASIELKGIAADADGTIVSYEWTKLSGPSSSTIVSPFAQNTLVTNLVIGMYHFQLKVTDNGGLSAFDRVAIIVDSTGSGKTPWDY